MYEAQPLPHLSKIARLRNDICKAHMTADRPDQPIKLASRTDRRNLQDQQVQLPNSATSYNIAAHLMLWRRSAQRTT